MLLQHAQSKEWPACYPTKVQSPDDPHDCLVCYVLPQSGTLLFSNLLLQGQLTKAKQQNAELAFDSESLDMALDNAQSRAQRLEQDGRELQEQVSTLKQKAESLQHTLEQTLAEHEEAQQVCFLAVTLKPRPFYT